MMNLKTNQVDKILGKLDKLDFDINDIKISLARTEEKIISIDQRFKEFDERFKGIDERLGRFEDRLKSQDGRLWTLVIGVIFALFGFLGKVFFMHLG